MKILLNTELVRAIVEKNQIKVFIRMANGQWAMQRPYDADLRGQIAALTLSIDALAGKIILQDVVELNDKDFAEPKPNVMEINEPKRLAPGNAAYGSMFKPKV